MTPRDRAGGAAFLLNGPDMKSEFQRAQEHSSERARFPAMTVIDIRVEQAGVADAYKNIAPSCEAASA